MSTRAEAKKEGEVLLAKVKKFAPDAKLHIRQWGNAYYWYEVGVCQDSLFIGPNNNQDYVCTTRPYEFAWACRKSPLSAFRSCVKQLCVSDDRLKAIIDKVFPLPSEAL